MFNVNRRPAALAAVAARAARGGGPVVHFVVTHHPPAPPDQRFPAAAPERENAQLREALLLEVDGIRFEVATWSPQSPVPVAPGVTMLPATLGSAHGPGDLRYRGSASTNPNFLYDSTRSLDVLVTFGAGRWRPTFLDSLMLGTIVEGLARAAAEQAKAPILFLQCPVSPFMDLPPKRFRLDGSGESPRISQGMAVRMAVGLDEGGSAERLDFLESLTGFAQRHGLGLQIGDRRYGRVRGEWWSVCEFDATRYAAMAGQLYPWASADRPQETRMVTAVGPARVGASMVVLSDLVARNVGIMAAAVSTMQEIAFVNLLLPLAPARSGRHPLSLSSEDLLLGLSRVASDCGLTPRSKAHPKVRTDLTPALDYVLLNSGPLALAPVAVPARTEYPIWVSWDLPVTKREVRDVARLLLSVVEGYPEVLDGTTDYFRARAASAGRERGRAKISLRLAGDPPEIRVPDLLGTICSRAQAALAAQLVDEGVAAAMVKVRVAWRERWLGRWSSVL